MRTLGRVAASTMDKLTANMEPGQIRYIGERGGAFMQVVVERLDPRRYSVSHYFEQNGDMVSDPDMEFYHEPEGTWLPLNITMAAGYHSNAVELDDAGEPVAFNPNELHDLCTFAATWMRNIRAQQNLKAIPAAE